MHYINIHLLLLLSLGGRLLHLPSGEAVSVWPIAHPCCIIERLLNLKS